MDSKTIKYYENHIFRKNVYRILVFKVYQIVRYLLLLVDNISYDFAIYLLNKREKLTLIL